MSILEYKIEKKYIYKFYVSNRYYLFTQQFEMNINMIGVSNLIIKPVPKQYRAKIIHQESLNKQDIFDNIVKLPNNDRKILLSLLLVISGADLNLINPNFDIEKSEIIVPPITKISDEAYQWMDIERNNNNLFYIDWEKNIAYYKTENSEEIVVQRSYTGFISFRNAIKKITNEHIYFPANRILDTLTCRRYYNLMSKVWKKWKDIYIEKLDDNIDLISLDEIKNSEYEIEFYIKLTKLLKCASESGIIICN